jgi:hypothetical protein
MKLYESRNWLVDRYHKKRRTPQEIAEEAGCSVATIYSYLRKFGLAK